MASAIQEPGRCRECQRLKRVYVASRLCSDCYRYPHVRNKHGCRSKRNGLIRALEVLKGPRVELYRGMVERGEAISYLKEGE